MAHLNKEQYAYRRESAARRNADNETVAVEHGMTEEQAGLISDLCRLRHELHTNMDAVTRSDADLRIKAQLVAANAAIKESGLTPVPCIPTDGATISTSTTSTNCWRLKAGRILVPMSGRRSGTRNTPASMMSWSN